MLKINVGLNKKASRDFQSTGLSINLEAELDSSLLARPAELQAKIDGLYAQAQDALERQAAAAQPAAQVSRPAPQRNAPAPSRAPAPRPASSNGSARLAYSSATAGRVGRNAPPAATDSQIKAIKAIAHGMGIDHEAEADAMGFKFPLSRGDASRFIDHLKTIMQQPRAAA